MTVIALREPARHEAQLHKRAHAVGQQAVVHLIDVRKVVDGLAAPPFAIDADIVIEDAVKAHVAERCDAAYGTQVLAITLAQAQHRTPRSEHVLPEMRQWPRGCRGIYRDGLGDLRGERCRGECEGQERDWVDEYRTHAAAGWSALRGLLLQGTLRELVGILKRCEPAAGESRALEALLQVGTATHHSPHQVAAIVLDHGEDRPLIDADVVRVNPAGVSQPRLLARRTAISGVEGIQKPIHGIDGSTKAM